jgi:hypothetical protein
MYILYSESLLRHALIIPVCDDAIAPVSWERDPRNIERSINLFKAEDLLNFRGHYLLLLCINKVDPAAYKALQSLVLAISIATSYKVTNTGIQEVEDHIVQFAKWYYDTFYQGK